MQKKILILEDEKELASLYAKFLKANGYDPVLAFDGIEGLERLKEMTPDLILLDLSMPNMGGVGFYQQLCGAEGKPRFPILVLTGRMDLERVFKDLLIDGLLLKPFEKSHLLKEVETIINKHCGKHEMILHENHR
ncbi:MAG: response regulator [Candidatus Omnitrophota bacterium]